MWDRPPLEPECFLESLGTLAQRPALLRAAVALLDTRDFLESEDPELGRGAASQLERLTRRTEPPEAGLVPLPSLLQLLHQVRHLLLESAHVAGSSGQLPVSAATARVPTMLCPETMRYYCWLGTQLSGIGDIVEFGVWLGSSTRCLCEGLVRARESRERDPLLHAYDAFVWQSWMRRFVDAGTTPDATSKLEPAVGDDFLDLYQRNVHDFHDRIAVHRCQLESSGTGHATTLDWNRGRAIELLVYDMGPDAELLRCIWENLVPCFIPGRTLVVMNEYGKLGSQAIWRFCNERKQRLVPLHKPRASTKTFLYVDSDTNRPSGVPAHAIESF